MKKCAYKNLGCKVNAAELEAMTEQLEAAGFETVPFSAEADVYVIHTCTVTNIADRKSRQMIRAARRKNKDACIVAVGCSVQASKNREAAFSEADILIGTNRKAELLRLVEKFFTAREQEEKKCEIKPENRLIEVPDNIRSERAYEEQKISKAGSRCRGYLKIEDGCNRFCSYCGIPFARGSVRSRKINSVIEEAKRLALSGVREIIIGGIDVSSYGADLGEQKEGLADVVALINNTAGISRVRLSSVEPGIITEKFLKSLADCESFCPQFHLSLQSGSDTVLKRMNRHYTTEEYLKKCEKIRDIFPDAALTTDIIAGFPKETEEEFEETKAFIKKAAFSRIHVFPYSRREGTDAAKMDGQLSEKAKKERANELIRLGEELALSYSEKFLGRTVEILIEETKEHGGEIFSEGYTAEYVRAEVLGPEKEGACIRAVCIKTSEEGKLLCVREQIQIIENH